MKRSNTIQKIFCTVIFICLMMQLPSGIFSIDERANPQEDYEIRDELVMDRYQGLPEDRVIIYSNDQEYRHEAVEGADNDFNQNPEVLRLGGDPYIITSEDFLAADEIFYFNQENRGILRGEARVRHFEDDLQVYGDQIEYNLSSKSAVVEGNAKVIVPSEDITITADKIVREFLNQEEIITATINVHMIRELDGSTMSCGRAEYNRTQNIITLTNDNPTIDYESLTINGNQIIMDVENEEMQVHGNSVVTRGQAVIKSDDLEYKWGENESAVFTSEGNNRVEYIQQSREESMLGQQAVQRGQDISQRRPARRALANIISYQSQATDDVYHLSGNAQVLEYYVRINENENRSSANRYRLTLAAREGYADDIFIMQQDQKAILFGNSVVKQDNYLAFADTIMIEQGQGNTIYLDGDVTAYEFDDEIPEDEILFASDTGELPSYVSRKSTASHMEFNEYPTRLIILNDVPYTQNTSLRNISASEDECVLPSSSDDEEREGTADYLAKIESVIQSVSDERRADDLLDKIEDFKSNNTRPRVAQDDMTASGAMIVYREIDPPKITICGNTMTEENKEQEHKRAILEDEDMKAIADKIIHHRRSQPLTELMGNNELKVPANVQMYNQPYEAEGMKIFHYYYSDEDQKIIMLGDAKIIQEHEPDANQNQNQPGNNPGSNDNSEKKYRIIAGNIIEYFLGDTEYGVIYGDATIKEIQGQSPREGTEDRTLKADVIEYVKSEVEGARSIIAESVENVENTISNLEQEQTDENSDNTESGSEEIDEQSDENENSAVEPVINTRYANLEPQIVDGVYSYERIYLTGNVNMEDSDMSAYAHRGEYYILGEDEFERTNFKITLLGNVLMIDKGEESQNSETGRTERIQRELRANRGEYTQRYLTATLKQEDAILCGEVNITEINMLNQNQNIDDILRTYKGDLMEYHRKVQVEPQGTTEIENSLPEEFIVITGSASVDEAQRYAEADIIEYYMDDIPDENEKHEHIVFIGNVFFEDPDNTATGHRVDVDITETQTGKLEKYRVVGNAVVIQESTVSYSRATAVIIEMITKVDYANSEDGEAELQYAILYKDARLYDHSEELQIINNMPVYNSIEDRVITAGMLIYIMKNTRRPYFNEYIEGKPLYLEEGHEYSFLVQDGDEPHYPVLELSEWKEYIASSSSINASETDSQKTTTTVTSDLIRYARNLKKAVAQGDVRIVQEDMEAFGSTAEFYQESNEVQLTGNCRVVQGRNIITGGHIYVDLDEKRVNILGAPMISLEADQQVTDEEEEDPTSTGLSGMDLDIE